VIDELVQIFVAQFIVRLQRKDFRTRLDMFFNESMKFAPITGPEICRLLEANGWRLERVRGSHRKVQRRDRSGSPAQA
jgi:hypothetical protein